MTGLNPLIATGCCTVKLADDVVVPFEVTTVICPLVAPTGTAVTIWLLADDDTVAAVPLNFTDTGSARLVPEIVTVLLTTPTEGDIPVIVGVVGVTGVVLTVKDEDDVAVPPAVVTVMVPVVAPLGTEVSICVLVADFTEAAVPLNFTVLFAAVVSNPVPLMVTAVLTAPETGVNDVMVGTCSTVKSVDDVAVPFDVVTVIVPVVAPLGTVAVIDVFDASFTVAAVPLKLTVLFAAMSLKFCPEIVTVVFTVPEAGVNPDIAGTAGGVSEPLLLLPPPPLQLASAKLSVSMNVARERNLIKRFICLLRVLIFLNCCFSETGPAERTPLVS
jgi:hypothetical protein